LAVLLSEDGILLVTLNLPGG